MKKLILSMATLLIAIMGYAQNTLVATLTHGDEISMYYGTYALQDAYNAANNGDVINLSGGTFQSVDIYKNISIRGAGIGDSIRTYIRGGFTINIKESTPSRLLMEGVRFTDEINIVNSNDPYFFKCRFTKVNCTGELKNAMFANCIITVYFYIDDWYPKGKNTITFLNSSVHDFKNYTQEWSANFINCVMEVELDYYAGLENLQNTYILNSIVFQDDEKENYKSEFYNSIVTNCLIIGFDGAYNEEHSCTGITKLNYDEFETLFKNSVGEFSSGKQEFELSDEAKTKYLGTDGTEVGMHGGLLPYSSILSYPRITKMNVANKTTADGKLSVEIEVSAAE